ncbi:MAG TPA: S-adenosylmethionine:tRNA ribosyltransferase-isomerase [Chryseosolibacter sp.]|nr:S-adenosylmethionine:tRNA ribosyltransferase-isomerase [Chryseosolibacter sp.]
MDETNINNYRYDLPNERIALHPLSERDQSKLLVYKKGALTHERFKSIDEFLPEGSLLVFNNTRVIPARLHFVKETGATIEIFLLSPRSPSTVISTVMEEYHACEWQCTIGNLKRWTGGGLTATNGSIKLTATLLNRNSGTVRFSWSEQKRFAEIVDLFGKTPLPPYLKREAEPDDKSRYQTIYSKMEGAVAAPTAGLHFTDAVFENLKTKNIKHDFVTLHVSAGTFMPVKSDRIEEHVMHEEQIIVTKNNIEKLLSNEFIIPVGTTSMRTLESLYWFGVKLAADKSARFEIGQDDPYILSGVWSKRDALMNVVHYMNDEEITELIGSTSIFIKPGYDFKICGGLITNFHQPASTLILLVAAFVGEDWRKIYEEALSNDYRFLSYGDSSLLLP